MKSIFRTIVLASLAMTVSVSALAAGYVKVSGKDGKATCFALSEKPEVTFSGNDLVLKTERETVNYPLSDVLTFEFTDETTGIGSSIKGEGLQPGSRVDVYAVNGQTVGTAIVTANGSVEISLNGQSGVFIVKSLNKTFKFIKK